jgi:hypothetical protein
MAHAALNGVTGPLAGYRSVSADPRSGTGLAATPGAMAYDGTTYYECIGTGVNDWRSMSDYQKVTVTGSPGQSMAFSGLVNADAGYDLYSFVTIGTDAAISLQINGATTSISLYSAEQEGASCVGNPLGAAAYPSGIGDGGFVLFNLRIMGRSGARRMILGGVVIRGSNGVIWRTHRIIGDWVSTDAITAVSLVSGNAAGLAVGSFATLTSNLRGMY